LAAAALLALSAAADEHRPVEGLGFFLNCALVDDNAVFIFTGFSHRNSLEKIERS